MKTSDLIARLQEIQEIVNQKDLEIRVGVEGDARPIARVNVALHESVVGSGDLDEMITIIEFEPA